MYEIYSGKSGLITSWERTDDICSAPFQLENCKNEILKQKCYSQTEQERNIEILQSRN